MSYVEQQLLAAVRTAVDHPDPTTRERAEKRGQAWVKHLAGVLTGAITTGIRNPVRDLPAWVTLEVLHGGFVSGKAAAGGPLSDDEQNLARDLDLPRTRAALNAWHLSDLGRARLSTMLEDGRYVVTHPENAALLVVTWLVRTGDTDAAVSVLEQVGPYMDRLRFYPVATMHAEPPSDHVFRRSEATTRATLASRAPNPRVAAQREALTVWAPFADELLALWWPVADGTARLPDDVALADSAAKYRALAAQHTRSTSHTSPKANLGVLVAATLRAEAQGDITDADRARVIHAARAMVARRGLPGSAHLAEARAQQRKSVAAPSHAAVARIVAERLDAEATRRGVPAPEAVLAPIAVEEATTTVPAGASVPPSVLRTVALAAQATIEELHERGVVPSAEVLAELVPQLVSAQHASTHPDAPLGILMARTYQAFRDRRSLLLTDLSAQVKLGELPWVAATDRYRTVDDAGRDAAAAALRRVGGLYLQWFGGTPLPNPLLVELEALASQAGLDVPLVPELAADIFQDAFSRRFGATAALVAEHAGPGYIAYYGLGDDLHELSLHDYDRQVFARLCRRRAEQAGSGTSRWSVSRNGMVIEQAQLLTSHNLASLAALGVSTDPEAAARLAFAEVQRLIRSAQRPGVAPYLAMGDARAAGLAWRHFVWFTALLPEAQAVALIDELTASTSDLSPLTAALADLATAHAGTTPKYPLLGWSNGPHPLVALAGNPR